MHYILKYISFLLPLTFASESLRGILARGREITEPVVFIGFIATLIWIVLFLIATLLVLKLKRG